MSRLARISAMFLAASSTPPLFFDNFNGTGDLSAHTPDIGGVWNIVGTTPVLTGTGKLKLRNASAVTEIYVNASQSVARFDMTWKMSHDVLWSSNIVFYFNYLDNNNHWYVYYSPPYVQLFQRVAGVTTQRGTNFTDSSSATGIKIRITTNEGTDGDTVKVYINGALWANWTAGGRPGKDQTGIGLRSFVSGAAANVHIDNVTITV